MLTAEVTPHELLSLTLHLATFVLLYAAAALLVQRLTERRSVERWQGFPLAMPDREVSSDYSPAPMPAHDHHDHHGLNNHTP